MASATTAFATAATGYYESLEELVLDFLEERDIAPRTAAIASGIALWCLLWWFLLFRARWKGYFTGGPPVVCWSPRFPIPVLGVLIEFFYSPHQMIRRCYHDYGPVFTIPVFFKRLTYLVGPEAQELFFRANDDLLSQNEVYDFMKPVFGPGVVYDCPKKNRQVQFQTMANGLRANRLKVYVPKIEQETRRYLQQELGDEGEVDLLHTLSELTILTASRCLHGDDVREHLFKEVCELYHDLDKGLVPYTPFWPTAPTQAHKKRDAARLQMVELFGDVIQQRRENPSRSDGTDILQLFMGIKYKDGTPITTEEITGLLIALLFAGQHTSCITSTWTTHLIAHHPTVLDKVMAEQEAVLGNQPADYVLQYEDVQKMEMLHNSMREALRMCPTFIMVMRRAERPAPLTVNKKGSATEHRPTRTYVIPRGDFVAVSPTVSMRLDTTFKNAETYDPERFMSPREEHKTPYAYLGFGGGLHSCMGQNFAFVQVKTILSILFREYEMERVSPDLPNPGYEDMVVGPVGNCRMRYKKRQRTGAVN